MTTIVHRTNGLIDIQAFTLMGMSAKPFSNNPIGRFGTGLKYAIAVLVRSGARPVLWIGQDRYEFFAKPGNFRGKDFERIRMKRQKFSVVKPTHQDLPFTTDYGRDWEMWMAFRELEANTRDEDGGQTFGVKEDMDLMEYVDRWHTCLMIEDGDYTQAWEDRDRTFLPAGLSVAIAGENIQLLPGGNKHLYYRGMRAKDLGKPSLFTYNVLGEVGLTEDRQIGSEYTVRQYLASYLVKSKDKEFIKTILTAPDTAWEHGLDLSLYTTPSDEFKEMLLLYGRKSWSSVGTYYDHHYPKPVKVRERIHNQIDLHPAPWKYEDDSIWDNDYVEVVRKPYGYDGDWESLAEDIIKRCNKSFGLSTQADFNVQPETLVVTQAPQVAADDIDEEFPF